MISSNISQESIFQRNFKFLTSAQIKETIQSRIEQYEEIKALQAKIRTAFDECMQSINAVYEKNEFKEDGYSSDKEKLEVSYGSKLSQFKQNTMNLAELIGYYEPEYDYRSMTPRPSTIELWQQALKVESPTFEKMVKDFCSAYQMANFFSKQKNFGEINQIYIESPHEYALKFLLQSLLSISFKNRGDDLIAVPTTSGIYASTETIVTDSFAIKYKVEEDEFDFMDNRTMITLKITDPSLLENLNKAIPEQEVGNKKSFPDFDDD